MPFGYDGSQISQIWLNEDPAGNGKYWFGFKIDLPIIQLFQTIVGFKQVKLALKLNLATTWLFLLQLHKILSNGHLTRKEFLFLMCLLG